METARNNATSKLPEIEGQRATRKKYPHPSPRKAIRKMCLECMGGSAKLVATCFSEKCPLWHHRFGKYDPEAPLTPIQAIRKICLNCRGNENAFLAIRRCEGPCPLHPFRLGTNPNCKRK
ncbi:MAG: restriction endonuclease [Candidatus Pacebacteria bacterium]|nr:restriction endonuclease [Candidatus Paceibacterota bacterium]